MIRWRRLEHRFVTHLPERLEPGILYISMEFATASHSCCCGCGEEVVTPFSRTDWNMTFDGETVSLRPSVGNWNQPCRSHYVIRNGEVIEAMPWSDAQVEAERRRDRLAKQLQFEGQETNDPVQPFLVAVEPTSEAPNRNPWLTRVFSAFWSRG